MNYYLGVDIGTTSTKAIAFSEKGQVLASSSAGYGMQHPQPGFSEQNPAEILTAVISTINKTATDMAAHTLAFVSFSVAMHSLIIINSEGNALTECIIWADNRAESIANRLRSSSKGMDLYQKTGVPVHSMSPLCKIIWIKENEPDLFKRAHKFIGIKEYVFNKLFGKLIIDSSVASATGILNIRTLQWDQPVLDFLGINAKQLPEVVSPMHTFNYAGRSPLLSLPQTTIVTGASDGGLSNMGSRATDEYTMAISIGTSGAARIITNEVRTDPDMRTFCYHLKDDNYFVGGANNNGAVVLQWLKEMILQSDETYEQLFTLAESAAPGCDGLLFLPYILGERAPLWNSRARGIFYGLTIQHSKAHVIRAALEGVAFCLYSIGSILMKSNAMTVIRASGGFAQSGLWVQIIADVFNSKVIVPDSVESSALGAVMLGAEAMGLPHQFEEQIISVYEPDPINHKVYQQKFRKFERLYDLLKTEMSAD